jgi:hypothetical protein
VIQNFFRTLYSKFYKDSESVFKFEIGLKIIFFPDRAARPIQFNRKYKKVRQTFSSYNMVYIDSHAFRYASYIKQCKIKYAKKSAKSSHSLPPPHSASASASSLPHSPPLLKQISFRLYCIWLPCFPVKPRNNSLNKYAHYHKLLEFML